MVDRIAPTSTIPDMPTAWSGVFAILDRTGGWMLEERSRPRPAPAPPVSVTTADELSARRHAGHVLDRVWFDMTPVARVRAGEEVAAFRTALAAVEVPG